MTAIIYCVLDVWLTVAIETAREPHEPHEPHDLRGGMVRVRAIPFSRDDL